MSVESLRKIADLVSVVYYAYTKPPFDPDASGYVPANKLLPAFDDRYTYWDRNDELVPRSGFMIVYAEDDSHSENFYVVRCSNIYTKVFEHDGIEGRWAANYPGGNSITGMFVPTHTDADGTCYIKHHF